MFTTKIAFFLPLVCLIGFLPLKSVSQEFQAAEPIGGQKELDEFLCNEMIYPEKASNTKTEGTVSMKFIVRADGTTSVPVITHSVSADLDIEALRLFRMILWKNALKMGKPVDSEMDLKVEFNLKKYKKQCKKRGFEDPEDIGFPIDTSNMVYSMNEIDKSPEPTFEDGMNYSRFITQNLKYPETAFRQNIAGKVTLKFVVEPNGYISHMTVEEPLGGGCSQEAIRLAKMMKYRPGIRKGFAVRTWMNLSITFRLPDSQDLQYIPTNPASAF
ncbi:MAG: energy transducer TonB [Bacteroidetes bacterium]|nr:energy transducer TonB [Bacteroidota bacterium]